MAGYLSSSEALYTTPEWSHILASYVAFKSLKVRDNSVPRNLHNIICDTT
jgi:hypothetical protein